MKQSGNWFYYLADGLGSTMAIVNASGTVQNSYAYDVYGKPTVTGSLSNEFDFAGQQTDSTGLQYLRARYMDPETGTFLSRDPLARFPGWIEEPYGYGRANPINLTDPTGLCITPTEECTGSDDWGSSVNPNSEPQYCVGPTPAGGGACIEDGPGGPDTSGGLDVLDIVKGWVCVAVGACVTAWTTVIEGVQFWGGKGGQNEAFKRYKDMGQSEYQSRNKLERLKKQNGLRPNDDVVFDERGNVYQEVKDPKTGEKYLDDLGNILDDSFGSGDKR
jgi:RHS repeat-associated protein